MTIKAFNAGAIGLSEIRAEFGGPTTNISMFAYRSGGPYVPVGTIGYPPPSGTATVITSFPTNGSSWNFSLAGFYGSSAVIVPTYSISPSTTSANEGTSITFSITTTNVANGTVLAWEMTNKTGDINGFDFVPAGSVGPYSPLSGQIGTVTINSNAASFVVTFTADQITDGIDTFQMRIGANGGAGPWYASTPVITINDTSITPPTYTYTETVSSNLTGGYDLRARALSTSPRYGSNLTNGTSWNGVSQLNATVTVNAGVYIVGTASAAAFSTGSPFPSGSTLTLTNNGVIAGLGGTGGLGAAYSDSTLTQAATAGSNGGTAFSASYPINVYNNGTIGGGGGGGGGGGAAYLDQSYDDTPVSVK